MFVQRTVSFKDLKNCDITAEIRNAATKSGIQEGTCSVTVLSESAGIVSVPENRQEILDDIWDDLDRVLPPRTNYQAACSPELAAGRSKAAFVESSKDFIIHEGEVLTSGNVYLLAFSYIEDCSYTIKCC